MSLISGKRLPRSSLVVERGLDKDSNFECNLNWDLNSDYIAIESQNDTFLGLLKSAQVPFTIPQTFHSESPGISSMTAVPGNDSGARLIIA